ncbi:MAG: hypothetical protein Kow0042_00900 [Calditrichia bacterium]
MVESNRSLWLHAFFLKSRVIAFYLLGILILGFGCARQIRKPAEEVPVHPVPEIRVALSDNLDSATLLFKTPYRCKSEEAEYIIDESLGEFTVKFSGGRLVFDSPHRRLIFKDLHRIEFIPEEDGRFIWNSNTYRGQLTFVIDGGKAVAVNTLPLTQYLKGVVPFEIPSETRDYYPAVMAQAVASRTYASYRIQYPASPLFDVYSDTRDQVYKGISENSPLGEQAVEETRGLVLVNDFQELVETQYHSTCGGHVQVRGDYFPDRELPEASLADSTETGFNCSGSPLYRWYQSIDARSILGNLLQLNKISKPQYDEFITNGFDLEIEVKDRLVSGRVGSLSLQINQLKAELNEWEIRQALGSQDWPVLPSNLFFLKSSRSQTGKIYIIGAGFGHGRGMCQWGAIGLALKGKSFQEILRFYYPALSLSKKY